MTGGNIENQETLHYQTGNRNRVHQTPIIRAVIYPIQLLAIYKNRFLLGICIQGLLYYISEDIQKGGRLWEKQKAL
jgi:hypothetical protein